MKEIIKVKERYQQIMSDYITGLQCLGHAGNKCIRSVVRYLSQPNGY